MAKLATYVHVVNPDGLSVVLGPDDDLPDWAADRIDNPKVWAEAPDDGKPRGRARKS